MRRLFVPVLISLAAPVLAQPADDTAERCAEAAARYKDLYGRDHTAEPVRTVLMFKYRFCPEKVTVRAGEKLRYINVDKRTSHSVWLKQAGQPESERVFYEGVIEVDTRLPNGDHQVLCGPHWETDRMIGTISVEK
ncbi:MAG TPA: copper-binding protein [Beijerinckiaceae bacterium]|nr:copper-binding protein [Beijerinckiaceae bacterium]